MRLAKYNIVKYHISLNYVKQSIFFYIITRIVGFVKFVFDFSLFVVINKQFQAVLYRSKDIKPPPLKSGGGFHQFYMSQEAANSVENAQNFFSHITPPSKFFSVKVRFSYTI